MRKSILLSLFVSSCIFVACGDDSSSVDTHVNESHNDLSSPTANAASDVMDEGFTAHWSAVSGATEYDIDIAKDANFSMSAKHHHGIGGTSTFIDGLNGNTEYHYRVKAFNNGSNGSAYSNSISVLTLPNAPVAKDATEVGGNSFKANWEESSGITTYLLYVSRDNFPNNSPNNLPGYDGKEVTGTSHEVEGLESGKFYYYVLKTKNTSGFSKESNSISLQTN